MVVVLYTTREDGYARIDVGENDKEAKDELLREMRANNIIGSGELFFTREFMMDALLNNERGGRFSLHYLGATHQRTFISHALDVIRKTVRIGEIAQTTADHFKSLEQSMRNHLLMPESVRFEDIYSAIRRFQPPTEGLVQGKERR